MHAWGLRLRSARGALAYRASQYCLPVRLTPSAPLILAISELTTSGYPAYMCLFPTLQVRSCGRPHMGRGQDGSLLLSCMTLSFTTSHRFIPTLSRRNRLPHKLGQLRSSRAVSVTSTTPPAAPPAATRATRRPARSLSRIPLSAARRPPAPTGIRPRNRAPASCSCPEP